MDSKNMSLDDLIKKEKSKGKNFGKQRGGNKFGGKPVGKFGGRQQGNFVPRQRQEGQIFKNRRGNQGDNFRQGGRFGQGAGARIQRVSINLV